MVPLDIHDLFIRLVIHPACPALLAVALLVLQAGGCAPRSAPVTQVQDRTVLLSEHPFLKDTIRARMYRLRNGVRALLLADPRLGVVAHRSCVAVGQWHDGKDRYGMAHLVEHLVYDQLDRAHHIEDRIKDLAGNSNAFTWPDRTCYHIDVPPGELDWVLAFDSARLRGLHIEQDLLDTQRDVVLEQEEEKREESAWVLYQRIHALLYDEDQYRPLLPRWRDHLRTVTLEDVRGFFARYYRPSRMLVTLVGDFAEADALRRIEALYGEIPARGGDEPPADPTFKTGSGRGERRLTFRGEGLNGEHVLIAYRATADGDPRSPAMEVLAAVLQERLTTRLRLAEDVSVGLYGGRSFGLFLIDVEIDVEQEGGEAPAIEAEVGVALRDLQTEAPSKAELARAQALLQVRYYQGLRGAGSRAEALVASELAGGDYRLALERPAAYARVSARQVRGLARRYLRPQDRTVVFAGEPEEQEENGQ